MKRFMLFSILLIGCNEQPELKLNDQRARSGVVPSATTKPAAPEAPMNRAVQTVAYYTDWSGQITTLIVSLDSSPSGVNTLSVQLPSDYVLVGGGALTYGTSSNAGAFLTESRPDWNNNTWYARSKDHVHVDEHYLRVYAVGLKINGVSPLTLRSVMTVSSTTSSFQGHPSTQAYMPPPYKLIGGGAKANTLLPGSLLVHSYPNGEFWLAKSKDHVHSSPGTITAWAIGINEYIPGFGYIDVTGSTYYGNAATTSGGILNVSGSYWGEWAPTCPGAYSYYPDPNKGRMLCNLSPENYSYSTTSKDIVHWTPGELRAYMMRIRKRH